MGISSRDYTHSNFLILEEKIFLTCTFIRVWSYSQLLKALIIFSFFMFQSGTLFWEMLIYLPHSMVHEYILKIGKFYAKSFVSEHLIF